MAKILLTGAAGFIGLHVLARLSQEHEVVGIDNLSAFSNYEIKLQRIRHLSGEEVAFDSDGKLKSSRISFYKLDILDEGSLQNLFGEEQFDMVIHLAAMTGIRQSVEQPDIYEKVNVRGFFNIIECCRKFHIKRLLFASSSSVYGHCQDVPFIEQSDTDTPLNLYAATKKMNELIAHSYASLYQMHCIGLRFFTVYGPWNRPDMATITFIKNIAAGIPIKLYNHGNMQRDFTFVGDIVESIRRLTDIMMKQISPLAIPYQIFNIGGGHPVTLLDYVHTIETIVGQKAIIENHDLQKGEMLHTYADCAALTEFTGFRPAVDFTKGLADTVRWYNEYRDISGV
jgi:UDP-glucuronate 4-epimerase